MAILHDGGLAFEFVFCVPGVEGLYVQAVDVEKNEERCYRLDRMRPVGGSRGDDEG